MNNTRRKQSILPVAVERLLNTIDREGVKHSDLTRNIRLKTLLCEADKKNNLTPRIGNPEKKPCQGMDRILTFSAWK